MLKSTENDPAGMQLRAEGAVDQQDVIVAIDAEHHVTAWNSAAEAMLGWSMNEVVGRTLIDIFGDDHERNQAVAQLIETVNSTGSGRVELAVPTRAGQSILMEVNAIAMRDARSGQFTGAVVILRDIGLRRLMQNQLRASEQRLKAVLEHMPVGVWVMNSEGQIVMGNLAGQRIWAGARFVGLDYIGEYRARWLETGELLKPEEWAGYRAITYGEASINELLEIECFDGSRKIIRNSCIPFYDNGELLGAVVVNEDISDLRRTQDELKRYASELERSNRDLQDFAFVASHDLQEPLRKVKSFGALLQRRLEDELDAESYIYLTRMQQAAQRMQNMIHDLLAYSRVTTHGQPFQAVPLEQVLGEAVANLEGLVEQSGGQVIVLGPLPDVQGDPGQLRQLFQNLLGNALKFHRPGVPPCATVQVCAGKFAATGLPLNDSGDQVEISIADNGIGFNMQYAERIFQPFQRLHGRAEYDGNGIGLAICRRITERHGGTIQVRSIPGAGSEFIVSLPKAADTPSPSEATPRETLE